LVEEEEEEEAPDVAPPHSGSRNPEERAGVGNMWDARSRTGEWTWDRTNPPHASPPSLFALILGREQRELVGLLGEVCMEGGWAKRRMKLTFIWGFSGALREERKGGRREKGGRGRRRERRRKRKRTGK
jgi:hypothetical protein